MYKKNPLNRTVLVLNKNWLAVGTTTVRRALIAVFREAAFIIDPETYAVLEFEEWAILDPDDEEDALNTTSIKIKIPEIILLRNYSGTFIKKMKLSRRALLARDNYTCQYCFKRPPVKPTVDHVIPKSKGGRSSFSNTVIACRKCNERKGNKTLEELGIDQFDIPDPRNVKNPILAMIHPTQRAKSWDKFIN